MDEVRPQVPHACKRRRFAGEAFAVRHVLEGGEGACEVPTRVGERMRREEVGVGIGEAKGTSGWESGGGKRRGR